MNTKASRSSLSSTSPLPSTSSFPSMPSLPSKPSLLLFSLFLGLMGILSACSPSQSPDAASQASSDADRVVLEDLLTEFLDDVSAGDASIHERFWAEDLIYTSSDGSRFGKAAIVGEPGDDEAAEDDADEEELPVTYRAEEVDIRLYDDVAIVAFRLVGETTQPNGDVERQDYFNTGTFLKQSDVWSVIAWQATKTSLPDSDM